MVKLRLAKTGTTKKPKYKIVIVDQKEKRDGRFIEIIGHYNPMVEPPEIKVKVDRYTYWLSVGARPTKAVSDLFKRYERLSRVSS